MMALVNKLRDWADSHAPRINHQAVVKDIHAEVEITPGYFLSLNVANLIALCGLLLGSSPVIIGAMLISPLMGPILSFGFAFVTGDETIWQKAIRKILISIALSILVAALASYLSPLKELTGEILARTKPNLFDLIIAFLAGIVGAGAICTKKHFLTIVPGVAIATAVIPPLSVTGFGIATLNFEVFSGGFLLFFTNFVAIVLATCAVFFYYGFRRKMTTEIELLQMKKRFTFLMAVLVVISIPLALTLKNSIAEVRLNKSVSAALRQEFEQEKSSHLVNFNYVEQDNGSLNINAQLNTVRYLSEEELMQIQQLVGRRLTRKVFLNLEQVLVRTGGLKSELALAKPAPAPTLTHGEVISNARESVRSIVQKSTRRIDRMIAPATIPRFAVSFNNTSEEASIHLTVRRDTPLSSDEQLWLGRILSDDLELPVAVTVELIPFVPPLSYEPGQTKLTEPMKALLAPLGEIYRQSRSATITIEGFAERPGTKSRKNTAERVRQVSAFLVDECRIPSERIRTSVRRQQSPTVRVSLESDIVSPTRKD
jgi:uncharacterized hydrophobic protein (TIGR00271 family)